MLPIHVIIKYFFTENVVILLPLVSAGGSAFVHFVQLAVDSWWLCHDPDNVEQGNDKMYDYNNSVCLY